MILSIIKSFSNIRYSKKYFKEKDTPKQKTVLWTLDSYVRPPIKFYPNHFINEEARKN